MKVIFGLSVPDYKVTSVTWSDGGEVMERTLVTNGSVRDGSIEGTLYDAFVHRFSSHHPPVPAEVADIRTAFKYLGKMSDLVECLPEVQILPED